MKALSSIYPVIISVLLFFGCGNIFHDMKNNIAVTMPLYPSVDYLFPARDMTGVKLNQSILVSFNKEMDPASLTPEAFEIYDEDNPSIRLLVTDIEEYEGRIITLTLAQFGAPPPDKMFDYGRTYTITLAQSLYDTEGYEIEPGYSWSFSTCPEDVMNPDAAFDTEGPRVIAVTPVNRSLCLAENVRITAVFNEDIIPGSLPDEAITVIRDIGTPDETAVTGRLDYSIQKNKAGAYERIAVFTPDPGQSFIKNSLYTVTISGARDLAGLTMTPKEWTFRTGTTKVTLEDACNADDGFGTFGDVDGAGFYRIGQILRTDEGRLLYDMFPEDESGNSVFLDDIFDRGTGGEFAPETYLRIVHDGINVLQGLGLHPVKKILFGSLISPPKNQCYIDLMYGMFLLPRPVYWSRCESDDSVRVPEIYLEGYLPSINRAGTVYEGKFGSGWGKGSIVWDYSQTQVYPFGDTVADFMEQGTISVWWKPVSVSQNLSMLYVYLTGETYITLSLNSWGSLNELSIYAGAEDPVVTETGMITSGQWNHVYVIWDSDGFDQDTGNHIKVFVNNGPGAVTAASIVGYPRISVGVMSGFNIGGGSSAIDNLKVWNHVVSESPEWEYHPDTEGAGLGRENALHEIYGADADPAYDYRPRLMRSDDGNDANEGGVGYYYMP
jgi:hypothetical protein